MKICICSSLTFADEVLELGKMLEASGHEVLLPNGVINRLAEQPDFDPVRAKIDTRSNILHAEKIRECDAVLMCNFLKNCTPGYIGANCFAELYMAHYFEKPIFALFPLPDISYINDEIRSFGITVLNNELILLPPDYSVSGGHAPSAPKEPSEGPAPVTPISNAPIPADPLALPPNPMTTAPMANAQVEPITSGSVHQDIPAVSHNPLKQVRDSWFALWGKDQSDNS